MFKKQIKVASHNSVSGKDRKDLKSGLSALFDPQSVEALLEKNKENFYIEKLSGAKTLIYKDETTPYIIDATGKGDYLPSCTYNT